MNEQDIAVAEYLETSGATFVAVLLGETKRDNNWTCDEWRVHFRRVGKPAIETAFYTGTGHRKGGKPAEPTAASVLYSLILDAQGAEQPFDYWCADYGYDQDSRKALATYDACCAIRRQVNAFFTRDEREQLRAMLEDY